MIANPETLAILLEAVGAEIPMPTQFLKIRQEPEEGFLIISLPREENNELMMRTLNRIASAIYLLCNGERSIRDIVQAMRSLFPSEDQGRIAEDVIRTVRRLQQDGLLIRPGMGDK